MKNKKIFIGWNANNREIALKVGNILSANDFSPIVGGATRSAFTVNEEIRKQMDICDLAIFLIEKETKKDKNGNLISIGFNPNVMIELGYMLNKVHYSSVIRVLINMEPGELPSDLLGAWSELVEKKEFDENNAEEKEAVLNDVAEKIADIFFKYINSEKITFDKLDYFDKWETNAHEIYQFTGNTRISEKLIYGMQSAIYSGELDRLYNKLLTIQNDLSQDKNIGIKDYQKEHLSIVKCALAILNVFVVTKRLTTLPTDEQFGLLCSELEFEYEKEIADDDLRRWCKIFRTDKLELCYELFAAAVTNNEEKISNYEIALSLCEEVIRLINEQLIIKPEDKTYSLIYLAFANRNISQIYKNLSELVPENRAEYYKLQKEFCKKTYENRKELYEYYKNSPRSNSLTMDYISHEYLLSLAEQHSFEENIIDRKRIERDAKNIYNKWKDSNKIRNMIFNKVTEEGTGFLD